MRRRILQLEQELTERQSQSVREGEPARGKIELRNKAPNTYKGDSGETLRLWIFQVTQYLDFHRVEDDRRRIQYAAMHLEDRALLWWHNVIERQHTFGEPLPTEWDEFVRLLKREFQPVSVMRTARAKLEAAKQTTTVTEYVGRLRAIRWELPGLSRVNIAEYHLECVVNPKWES